MQDVIERQPGNRFVIRGRNADMVDVAGSARRLRISRGGYAQSRGADAVVFQPDAAERPSCPRVAALVVAPTLTVESIAEQIGHSVDSAFIPRRCEGCLSASHEVGKLRGRKMMRTSRGALEAGGER